MRGAPTSIGAHTGNGRREEMAAIGLLIRMMLCVGLAWLVGISAGCAGTPRERATPTMAGGVGFVTTELGEPLAGATVRVGLQQAVTTDAFGRFVLDALPQGTQRVRVDAEGYETVVERVPFTDRAHVLHVRLVGIDDLVDRAIAAAQAQRIDELRRLTARVAAIEPDDDRLALLHRLALEAPR